MLRSMTGYGEAHRQEDGLGVCVEVRCINSRYLKLTIRSNDGYGSLDSRIETILRKRIRRGTLQVNVRVSRAAIPEDYRVNGDVLRGYHRQLEEIGFQLKEPQKISLESLLALPGVVEEASAAVAAHAEQDWPLIQATLQTAVDNLDRMRSTEGQAMAADLRANCQTVQAGLDEIAQRAPTVVEAFRVRLTERLEKLLEHSEAVVEAGDLLKEVGLFAERSDISEEIVRLRSHLQQFDSILNSSGSAGRKLEFVTQEMVRESNTIGSKASDVEISRHVIEIKTAVERIREQIQNVE